MRKSHTKNILSMAPTVQMFTRDRETKLLDSTGKVGAPGAQSEQSYIKNARSISSFGKTIRESPQKKYTAVRSRPTLPKSNNSAICIEQVIDCFANDLHARSDEQLYADVVRRCEASVQILQQSAQAEPVTRLLKQIQVYFTQVMSQMLRNLDRQLAHYSEQLVSLCQEYEAKIQQSEAKQRLKAEALVQKQSEFGRYYWELRQKALNSTQIFNEMERNNINLMQWVKDSEFMDSYTLSNCPQFQSQQPAEPNGHREKIQCADETDQIVNQFCRESQKSTFFAEKNQQRTNLSKESQLTSNRKRHFSDTIEKEKQ